MSDLYDVDFYAWLTEQAALLRGGRLSEIDVANIAEELESMGRSEKRELVSRLSVLLLHLLKWQFQPMRRGVSWQLSISNARDEIAEHIEENPSLKSTLGGAMVTAYRRARHNAAIETGLSVADLPLDCPWTFEQAMSADLA
jgi:hypothetical protein